MTLEKFRKRPGTTDQGKDYENVLVAYYALKLMLNDEIADFKISSNDVNYGNFDDLVIQITRIDGSNEQFNIQAKHKQTNKDKNLLLEALAAKNGKFSLEEQFKEYNKNPNQHKSILFTNRQLAVSENIEKKLVKEEACFDIYMVRYFGDIHLVNTASETKGVFKFCVEEKLDDDKNEETQEKIKQYKNFFNYYYLFTSQKNVNDISNTIGTLFQNHFKCDGTVVKSYMEFIKTWSDREGKKNKLDKKFLKLKITELLLCTHILPPTFDAKRTLKFNLFKKAIDAFDVTIISNPNITKNFYHINKIENMDDLNKIGVRHQILPHYIEKISEISRLQRAILLWLLNKHPLMIKVTKKNEPSVLQAIQLCCGQNKKFILLGTNKRPSVKTFCNLSDLHVHCNKIYNMIVKRFACSFHGQKETSLDQIIDNDAMIRSAFTTDELILMLDENCNFGTPKENLPDCYVTRKLTKITIDSKFLEKHGETDQILISGKLEHLKNNLPDGTHLTPESFNTESSPVDLSTEFFGKNIYITDKCFSQEVFKNICKENAKFSCHHFQLGDDKNLVWLESSRSINNLKPFRTNRKTTHFEEETKVPGTYLLNVICADAGMGKSMMMLNIKNNYLSNSWVLKILPREHMSFFETKVSYEEFFQYLRKKLKLNRFEENIYDYFKMEKKLILIWDGIDEVDKEIFDNVLHVVSEIKTQGFVQWLTSRFNLKQVLEEKLNTLSRRIEPFERKDQQMFIMKRLNIDCKETPDEIMKKVGGELLRTPLQISMLTELCSNNSEMCKILLTQEFSVTDLFEYFVDEKFNFYYKKSNINVDSNNIAKQIIEEHKAQRIEYYQLIALNLCLHPRVFETLKLAAIDSFVLKLQTEGDSFGIVKIVNGSPSFAHRQYVEYFVALWLSKNFTKVTNLESFFFDNSFRGVRFMFDLIMAKKCPVHLAVLHKNVNGIRTHLEKVTLKDDAGRSPLHIASSWGKRHIPLNTQTKRKKITIVTEEKITATEEISENIQIVNLLETKCNIKEKDTLLHFDCIQYADRSLSLAALNTFARKHQIDFKQMKNFKDFEKILYHIVKFDYRNLIQNTAEISYIETTTGSSLLHLCAANNRQTILSKLLNNKLYIKNLNKRDQKSWTPLHYAVYYGHLDMIKKLKEVGADIHSGSKTGEETPLFVAAKFGQLEILKYLLNNDADVNTSKTNGWTPLMVAVQQSNFETVNILLGNKANVNQLNKDGYSPLYVAARKGNLDIVQFLISKKADVNIAGKNGETALYIAAKLGYLLIAKVLINHGANVKTIKTNGWTPLAIASKFGHLPMVKLLLEHQDDYLGTRISTLLQSLSWKSLTINPLQIALEKDHSEIAYLLQQHYRFSKTIPSFQAQDFVSFHSAQHIVNSTATISYNKLEIIIISILVIIVIVLMYSSTSILSNVIDKLSS